MIEKNKEEKTQDQQFNQEIEIAELLVSKIEKLLKENESKLKDIKPSIEKNIIVLKEAIEIKDLNMIKATVSELQEPVKIISNRIYKLQEKSVKDISCKVCQTSFNLPLVEKKEENIKKSKKK